MADAVGADPVALTKDLVAVDSVSRVSSAPVCDVVEDFMQRHGFEIERLSYRDDTGVRKDSVIGKKGRGAGGLAFYSHVDTVPGDGWSSDPHSPVVRDERLIGLGSCDMKGPLAATLCATAALRDEHLERAVYVAATADEEISGRGARQIDGESALYNAELPRCGVIAEPTSMVPVYAHKGGARVIVTAHGRAAHTSTGRGVSANLLMAPFLAELPGLAETFRTDESFWNRDFDPPTNGFNVVYTDFGTRPNVSAPKAVCTVSFRPAPGDRTQDVLDMVSERARAHGLEVEAHAGTPFQVDPDSEVVRTALAATGADRARTVPYGTDAHAFKERVQLVVMGPGDIAQAHTDGEWIELAQLHRAVDVYRRMVQEVCQA